MTNEEYCKYMENPLTESERQTLIDNGWIFLNEEYIYMPNDYDGCMQYGIKNIRKQLLYYKYPIPYVKHQGKCKEILEEILS